MDDIIPYGHQTLYAANDKCPHDHVELSLDEDDKYTEITTARIQGPNVTVRTMMLLRALTLSSVL